MNKIIDPFKIKEELMSYFHQENETIKNELLSKLVSVLEEWVDYAYNQAQVDLIEHLNERFDMKLAKDEEGVIFINNKTIT